MLSPADHPANLASHWVILVAAGLLAGCGGGSSEPNAPPAHTAAVPAALEPTEAGVVPAPAPHEAVTAVLTGLQRDDPHAVWQALPAGYQQDINRLIHKFAGNVDPEVWNRGTATLRKALHVLQARKTFLLEHPLVQESLGADQERIRADYDASVNLLVTLLDEQTLRLDRLKSADAGDFLRETGGNVMRQLSTLSRLTPGDPFQSGFKQILRGLTARTMHQDQDTARVQLLSPETGLDREVEFVKVEGKWLPRPLVEGWDAALDDAEAGLDRFAQATRDRRQSILARLERIDAALDALEDAQTQEAFNQTLAEQVVVPLRDALKGAPDSAPAVSGSDPGGTSVIVVFDRELDPQTKEDLQPRFSAITDDGQGLAVPRFVAGATQYEVMPVAGVEAFARKIDFLEVVAVDAAGRRITVRLP